MQKDEGRLTDEAFWDDFWSAVELPSEVDRDAIFERAFLPVLDRYLGSRSGIRVAEVGCAPGRWLAHCAQRFGASVVGYESSPTGAEMTRRNFRALGVDGVVVEEDFLETDVPTAAFEAVLSLGFIEHFDDPTDAVRRHAELLVPGGLLFLEVPNLRGLQLSLLRVTRSSLLDHHNLSTMSKAALKAYAGAAGLEPLTIDYIGGYEPSYVDLSGRSILARAPYAAVSRFRHRSRIGDGINSRFWSGYLCGVFVKLSR